MKSLTSLFNLQNNALFLRCWRETTRPLVVATSLLVTILVIGLILLTAYNSGSDPYTIDKGIFFGLSVFQGFFLLLFALISCMRMSQQEVLEGTIMFHRSSPTPVSHQLVGLIFGPSALMWLMTGLVACVAGFYAVKIGQVLSYFSFLISLCLFGVLFQAIAVFLGLNSQRKSSGTAGIFGFFIFYYVFISMFTVPASKSILFNLSPTSFYYQLSCEINGTISVFSGRASQMVSTMEYRFWGMTFNTLVSELILIVPLLILMLRSLWRKIKYTDRPVWTKGSSLLISGYVYFLLLGDRIGQLNLNNFDYSLLFMMGFGFIFGIFHLFVLTPSRLNFQKGLKRCQKLNRSMEWNEDFSSNYSWMIVFSVVSLVAFLIISRLMDYVSLTSIIWVFSIWLMYFLFFGGIFEFYRISSLNKRPIVFGGILVILWVLFPWFGFIFDLKGSYGSINTFGSYLTAFSPIGGITAGDKLLEGKETVWYPVVIPFVLAVGAMWLAAKERSRIKDWCHKN